MNKGLELLKTVRESLMGLSVENESNFLDVGRKLQSIHADASRLTQESKETISFVDDKNDNILSDIGHIAERSLVRVKSAQKALNEDLNLIDSHLGVVSEQLVHLEKLYGAIRNTAKSLHSIGLQMNMECSRTERTKQMFSVVAKEVVDISNNLKWISNKIRDGAEDVEQRKTAVEKQTSEAVKKLLHMVDDGESTVKNAAQQVEAFIGVSLENLHKIRAASKKISQSIGKIVVGLQFHDNMRQRIVHICMALEEIQKRCISYYTDNDGENPLDKGSAYSILELQKDQLWSIIKEIKAVYENTGEAFLSITDEIEEITNGYCVYKEQVPSVRSRGAKARNPFECLGHSLRHLYELIDSSSATIEGMRMKASEASDVISRLSSHTEQVGSVSLDTHLVAINAMIKANQLGVQGRTLNALVLEVAEISIHSNMRVADADKIGYMISASTDKLMSQTTDAADEDVKSYGTQMALDALMENIYKKGVELNENSMKVFSNARALQNDIIKASRQLEFLQTLAGDLKNLFGQLEDAKHALNLKFDAGENSIPEDLGAVAASYTMCGERRIHNEFITAKQKNHNRDEVSYVPVANSVDADLGANVELF